MSVAVFFENNGLPTLWWHRCRSGGANPLHELFEQLFRRDRNAVGDLGRSVEHLQHPVAQRAAKLARLPASGREFDAPEAGVALRADDIASSHAPTMHRCDDRSTTARGNLHAHRHVLRELSARVERTSAGPAASRVAKRFVRARCHGAKDLPGRIARHGRRVAMKPSRFRNALHSCLNAPHSCLRDG